jgi:transposase
MRPPIFVRPLEGAERIQLEAGLRSSDAFVLRRCQILLASARGQWARQIAEALGCDDQTVRNVIADFHARGLACLQRKSSRPHRIHAVLDAQACAELRELLHRSPRDLGQPRSAWTLSLLAEVAFAEGITSRQVSAEAVRQALKRLGIRWRRAKAWITSPDPAYAEKKGLGTV